MALQYRSRARRGGNAACLAHSRMLAAAVLAILSWMGPAAAEAAAAAAPGGPSGNRTAQVLAPVAAPKGSPGPMPSPGAGAEPSPNILSPAPAPTAVHTPGPSSGTLSARVPKADPSPGASPNPNPSPEGSPAGSSKASGGGPPTLGPLTSSPSATVVGGCLRGFIAILLGMKRPSVPYSRSQLASQGNSGSLVHDQRQSCLQ